MSDTPSESTSRLWADLLAGEDLDDQVEITAADIDRQSIRSLASRFARDLPEDALLGPQTPGATVGRVRLFGPAIEENAISFGLASKVLTVVQDALSVVGMSLRGKKTVNGAVPKQVREATLLRLHPQIGRGSVVLNFEGPQRPDVDDRLGGTVAGPNLADQAAASLLGIFDHAGTSDSEALTPSLQDLGPRVASHVRRIASLTLKEKVYLDLRWMQANGVQRSGRLTAEGGQFLETFIAETKASLERQELRGILITISTVEPLHLIQDTGPKLSIHVPDDFHKRLTRYFNQRVVVTVDAEIITNVTTGREETTLTLVDLELSAQASPDANEQMSTDEVTRDQ